MSKTRIGFLYIALAWVLLLGACSMSQKNTQPVPLLEEKVPHEIENRFLWYALPYIDTIYTITTDNRLSETEIQEQTASNMQILKDFYHTLQNTYTENTDDFDVFFQKVVTPGEIARYYVHIYETGDILTDTTIPDNRRSFSWFLSHYTDIWNYSDPDFESRIQKNEKIPFSDLPPEKKIEVFAYMDWWILLATLSLTEYTEPKTGRKETIDTKSHMSQRQNDFLTIDLPIAYPYLQEKNIQEMNQYFAIGFLRIQKLLKEQLLLETGEKTDTEPSQEIQ